MVRYVSFRTTKVENLTILCFDKKLGQPELSYSDGKWVDLYKILFVIFRCFFFTFIFKNALSSMFFLSFLCFTKLDLEFSPTYTNDYYVSYKKN